MPQNNYDYVIFAGRESNRQMQVMLYINETRGQPRRLHILFGGPEGPDLDATTLRDYAHELWPDLKPELESQDLFDLGKISQALVKAMLSMLRNSREDGKLTTSDLEELGSLPLLVDLTDTTGRVEAVCLQFVSFGWIDVAKAEGGAVTLTTKVTAAWRDAMNRAASDGFFTRSIDLKSPDAMKKAIEDFKGYYQQSIRQQQREKSTMKVYPMPFGNRFLRRPPPNRLVLRDGHWDVLFKLYTMKGEGPLPLDQGIGDRDRAKAYRNLRFLGDIGLADTQPRRQGLTQIGKGLMTAVDPAIKNPQINQANSVERMSISNS